MFKKAVILSVAVALITLGLFVDPLAAQVTNVSKRGSLLIFPKINTFTSPNRNIDTIILIGNDGASDTRVKCYWMDSTQAAWDLEFDLTAWESVWFSAKTGVGSKGIPNEFGDNKSGELKCWAIDINPPAPWTTEVAVSWNYLYGSALIIQSDPYVNAFEYLAWAFANNAGKNFRTASALNLNGTEYDACPNYLLYNFFALGGYTWDFGPFGPSTLSLSPCQQDLRQDKAPVCTKAKFDVWNANEDKLTNAYQCVKCYFEGILSEIGTLTWAGCDLTKLPYGKCKVTGNKGTVFTEAALKTDNAQFRVNPLAPTDTFTACVGVFSKLDQTTPGAETPVDVCSAARRYRTPFVGVLLTEMVADGRVRAAGTTGSTSTGGFNGNTNLTGGNQEGLPPQIKWDAGDIGGDGPASKR